MNKEIKKRWIDALRSGKYTQCSGILRLGNRFCVTGILCDLYLKDEELEWGRNQFGEFDCLNYGCKPSESIRVWADVSKQSLDKLIRLNDHGMTFDKMADWIEENL